MKKFLAILLTCVMMMALATTVSASKTGALKGYVPMVSPDEIVIDGVADAAYATGLWVDIKTVYAPHKETGTCGRAHLLWGGDYFYAYVTVLDAEIITVTPDLQEKTPYIADSYEMFFDLGNTRELPLVLPRVDYSGFASYFIEGGETDLRGTECDEYMEYAAKWTNTGYNVEMKVDLGRYMALEEGLEIGINLMVNEMTSASVSQRTAMVLAASKNNARDWDIDKYDYVVLGGDFEIDNSAIGELTPAVVTTEPVETEAPETEAPETEPEETESEETEPEETEEKTEEKEEDTKANVAAPVVEDESSFPVVPVVIGAVLIAIIVVVIVIVKKKKN